jgi:hypothetical protein
VDLDVPATPAVKHLCVRSDSLGLQTADLSAARVMGQLHRETGRVTEPTNVKQPHTDRKRVSSPTVHVHQTTFRRQRPNVPFASHKKLDQIYRKLFVIHMAK